jgi:hypothetical protein
LFAGRPTPSKAGNATELQRQCGHSRASFRIPRGDSMFCPVRSRVASTASHADRL